MQSRGIASAILDWYGQGHITDTVLGLLRNEAEGQGVEFSITEDVGAVAQYAAIHIGEQTTRNTACCACNEPECAGSMKQCFLLCDRRRR